jgi:aminoglycoside 6'-N-acetyltransferase I
MSTTFGVTEPSPVAPIVRDQAVRLPPSAAFRLFTEQLDSWWPREYTWAQDALEWIGLQPRLEGRCTEVGPHGFQCDWGHVIRWEPPTVVELAWQISPRREPVPDRSRASRVRVEFTADGTGSLVRLHHDGFERHGAEGGAYRDALAADQGWPLILARYARAARAAATTPRVTDGSTILAEIRILAPGDTSALDRVAPDVFDEAVDARWAGEFLGDPRHHLAVALDEGVVVGMASAVHYVHPDKAPELWINEVGVAASHQRRGIAQRLLQALFARGRSLGCVQAWVLADQSNGAALRLYARAGGRAAAEPCIMVEFPLADGTTANAGRVT